MRKSHVSAGLGLSLLAVQLACGGDGTSGGTPAGVTLCAQLCARVNDARCAGEVGRDCQATCLSQLASAPASCTALVEAYATCAGMNVFTCDSKNEASPPAVCAQQGAAWVQCKAQASVDAGTPSQDAGGDDGGTTVLVGGLDSGPIQAPAGDAASVNPGVLADAGPLDAGPFDSSVTMSDAGGSPPICRPEPNDGACSVCGQSSCCPELSACDAECRAVGACVAKCANNDNNCIQACGASATDQATDQYNAIVNCYNTKCAVACGG